MKSAGVGYLCSVVPLLKTVLFSSRSVDFVRLVETPDCILVLVSSVRLSPATRNLPCSYMGYWRRYYGRANVDRTREFAPRRLWHLYRSVESCLEKCRHEMRF